ncbi:putative transcriptional regulator [Rhizobium sp. AN67]|nr:putative transcriptional regulator [Rhizobium sp. AN67]SOD51744.1 hypothetical protein SAMN05216595_0813 [Rhizobium sp. AN6A]
MAIFMFSVQVRMARAALGWGVVELAEHAGISTNTLVRLEKGEDLKQSTIDNIRFVLEKAGVKFVDNEVTFGVLVNKDDYIPLS